MPSAVARSEPPLKASVPEPRASPLAIDTTPSLKFVVPAKPALLSPASVSVPVPVFVKLDVATPIMLPPNVDAVAVETVSE